jgi:membrane-associated protease RseP (regulator of RpoE activity)
VKAVILGGYCRIIGMTNLEDVEPEDEPRAYRSKGYFARVLVAGAGPAVHFVIALVLMFTIFFVAGDTRNERFLTRLDQVSVGAKAAGLRAGDRIVEIGDKRITDWSQVAGAIEHHKAGDHVQIVVDRGGVPVTKDVELTQSVLDGQTHVIAGISATILVPHPGFFGSIAKAPGGVVTVGHEAISALGTIFSPSGMSKYFHVLAGTDKNKADQNARFLSPIGFATTAAHAVDAGWLAVVTLLLVINVFVGLINLVPLLPFDGGHIAIATYEKISSIILRRKVTVDAAKLMPIAAAVLVLLLFIFVSSVFLDITPPVANPF